MLEVPLSFWVGFHVIIISLLMLDLGVFHRRVHEISMREAGTWCAVWVSLSLAFNLGVYFWAGPGHALDFLTGYLIEYSLSADNVFVFVVIFSFFMVPKKYQHRVLFWGILGAAVMRGIFIVAGVALLRTFHSVMYIFGAFLIFTAFKLFFSKDEGVHPERNPAVKFFRRIFPVAESYHGARFFTRVDGKLMATPLLLVLLVIESTDVVFALDSIPAIFGITKEPFIVYTSNICAILGLRSLYFLLAGMVGRFKYLRPGLALILGFIGLKMLLADVYPIETSVSLLVVAIVLAASIGASVWSDARAVRGQDESKAPTDPPDKAE